MTTPARERAWLAPVRLDAVITTASGSTSVPSDVPPRPISFWSRACPLALLSVAEGRSCAEVNRLDEDRLTWRFLNRDLRWRLRLYPQSGGVAMTVACTRAFRSGDSEAVRLPKDAARSGGARAGRIEGE